MGGTRGTWQESDSAVRRAVRPRPARRQQGASAHDQVELAEVVVVVSPVPRVRRTETSRAKDQTKLRVGNTRTCKSKVWNRFAGTLEWARCRRAASIDRNIGPISFSELLVGFVTTARSTRP